MRLKNRNLFLGRIENIVGKGVNAGYQHFLLFPQCFQKVFFLPARQKWSLCGKGLRRSKLREGSGGAIGGGGGGRKER